MDLTTIIQQAALLNNSQAKQAQQVSDLMAGASTEASGLGRNLEEAGRLKAGQELTRLQGELNTQNARVKVANAFGTNANAQSDVITNMATAMRQDAVALVDAQNNVSRIEANSDLLGNPIGWVEDLLTGDEARAQRDALAASFDTKNKLVTNLNSATQTSVATQNAISETLTQTSIKQAAQAKVLQGAAEASKARIESAKYGVASVEALQQMDAQAFNRNMSVYNAIQQDEAFQFQRAARQAALKEEKTMDAFYDDMANNINAARSTFNMGQPVSKEYVKAFIKDPRMAPELIEQDKVGARVVMNGGSTEGALGATPADFFANSQALGIKTPPSWKPSMSVLEAANNSLAEAASSVGLEDEFGKPIPNRLGLTKDGVKNPVVMKNAFNQEVDRIARDAASLIKHNTGNPYQTPPIQSVLEAPTRGAQALKNSKFGNLVLGSLLQAGIDSPDPKLVVATGLSYVDKGELSFQEMNEGLGNYLEQGLGVVQATGGFGTSNVLMTRSYNVSIKDITDRNVKVVDNVYAGWTSLAGIALKSALGRDPGVITEKVKYDLLNPQERTTLLTILASQKTAAKLLDATKGEQP